MGEVFLIVQLNRPLIEVGLKFLLTVLQLLSLFGLLHLSLEFLLFFLLFDLNGLIEEVKLLGVDDLRLGQH